VTAEFSRGRTVGRCCAKLAKGGQPGVAPFRRTPEPQSWGLRRLGHSIRALFYNYRVGDPKCRDVVTTSFGVVAPVEPQGVDVGEQSLCLGRIGHRAWGMGHGANKIESFRLAPSMADPDGMPFRSVRMDHFHPNLPRSDACGRWHPSGWVRSVSGASGPITARTASPISGSRARMTSGTTSRRWQ